MTRHINLYDPALRRQRRWLDARRLALAAGVIVVCLFAWGAWLRMEAGTLSAQATRLAGEVDAARQQLTSLGTELARRKADPQSAQERQALEALAERRRQILAGIDANAKAPPVTYAEHLRGLARQSMNGLWLTGFAVTQEGDMEIRGRLLEPGLLPGYIRRLEAEPAFRGRRFTAVTVGTAGTGAAGAQPVAATAQKTGAPSFLDFALVSARHAEAQGGRP